MDSPQLIIRTSRGVQSFQVSSFKNIDESAVSYRVPVAGEQALKNCIGMRVCSTVSDSTGNILCDHGEKHDTRWSTVMNDNTPCVEMGTITNCYIGDGGVILDIYVIVQWDCGFECRYSYANEQWKNLKAIDPAPTGYKAPMIFCDICHQPVMGFAFRCASNQCAPITGADVLYDLCYIHYNEGKHSKDHPFRCNIPTGDIRTDNQTRKILTPRSDSMCYQAIGLLPGAIVASHNGHGNLSGGRIIRIVHAGGQTAISKAKHWRCSAEVDPAPTQKKLQYCDVGTAGKVTLKAVQPGVGGPIYVNHFPSLDIDLLKEMAKQEIILMNNGESCWVRTKPTGEIWSAHITDTDLTDIDDDEPLWSQCSELEVLNLIRNKLPDLPFSIKFYKGTLELVCLAFNCFTSVPSVVFELENLLHFSMLNNQISRLPADIGNLSRLTHMYFGRNKLQSLPDAFHRLPNLQTVSFKYNFLASLPSSFKNLKKLMQLELGCNCFRSIPEILFDLPELKVLDLEHNRIQLISPDIATLLERILSLNLEGNPLQHPELLDCTAESIPVLLKEILSQLDPSQKHLKTQRALVLGRCGAGKTSLVEALGLQKYVTPVEGCEHDHTVGINRYFMPIQMCGVVHELDIWDFAGEKTYGMINELFLAGNALNLVWLVVNLEQYTRRDSESYCKNVGKWLKGVLAHTLHPVVWVVCTHVDRCSEEEVRAKCAEIEEKIRQDCDHFTEEINKSVKKYEQECSLIGTEIPSRVLSSHKLQHYKKLQSAGPLFLREHLEVIPLTNTYGFKGLQTLKENLEKLSSKDVFHHLNDPLPESWMAAMNILIEHSKQVESPIVQRHEAHNLLKSKLPSLEVDQFLKYLHQSGEILQLSIVPDDQLKDKIILNVDWLINLLKHVFRHDFHEYIQRKKHQLKKFITSSEITQALKDKETYEVIRLPLLKSLWALEGVDPEKEFVSVISLIEEFGLAYKSRGGYLFPWRLKEHCPKEIVRPVAACHVTVLYDFNFIPDGFFVRFIVFCQQHLTVSDMWCDALEASCTWDNVQLQASYSCSNGTIKLCCYSDIPPPHCTYKQLWEPMMLLVQEMERLLKVYPGHRASRFVLCPNCTDVEPYPFDFEFLSPGPLSNSSSRGVRCSCTKRSSIELEKIVPPTEYMLEWEGDTETVSMQKCTATHLREDTLKRVSTQSAHQCSPNHALPYRASKTFTALQDQNTMGSLDQQPPVVTICHNTMVQPGLARQQCHYFQPTERGQLHGKVHHQLQDLSITQAQHGVPLPSPHPISPSFLIPRQVQLNTSETEPMDVEFPLIRAALDCTRQISDSDIIEISEKVQMRIPRWPMFARRLEIEQKDIDVIQLNPSVYSEPAEICFQFLDKWRRSKGGAATVATLAQVVQRLRVEQDWSEALKFLLRK